MAKLLYLVPNDAYFLSHRLPMARAAIDCGYQVGLVTRPGDHKQKIEDEGIRVIPCNITPGGMNPFRALRSLLEITRIYKKERPDLVHHVTLKAIMLGGLAAIRAKIPHMINAAAGLGYLFTSNTLKARVIRLCMAPFLRYILKHRRSTLLLQNPDDKDLLLRRKLAGTDNIVLIPGSGVETDIYRPTPTPGFEQKIICVFSGRMIGIKGLQALKDAFEFLEDEAPRIHLWLCGTPDPNNPGSWTEEQLKDWAAAPNIIWKGYCTNMAEIWQSAHIAVHPAEGGEGIPKALLEAAATGRAIIASDVPGCREIVKHEANGLLVPPKDPKALSLAIQKLAWNGKLCAEYGAAGPELVHQYGMTANDVQRRTRELYESLKP